MNNNEMTQDGEFCEIVQTYAVVCDVSTSKMRVVNTIDLKVHSTWKLLAEARDVARTLNNLVNREKHSKKTKVVK